MVEDELKKQCLDLLSLAAGENDEIKNTHACFLFSADLRSLSLLFTAGGDGDEKVERRKSVLESSRPRSLPGPEEKL